MVRRLAETCRAFGTDERRRKLRLLREVEGAPRLGSRDLVRLQDALAFILAYPDSDEVRSLAGRVAESLSRRVHGVRGGADAPSLRDSGLSGTVTSHIFSYGTTRRLVRLFPGALRVDWDDLETEEFLLDALYLLVTPGETQGLEDIELSLREWIEHCRPAGLTDMEFLVGLFERSALDVRQRARLFDACALRTLFRLPPGTGRCELVETPARRAYQRVPPRRETFPLARRILRPAGSVRRLSASAGGTVVRRALAVLCGRNLEIHALTWANPHDVIRVDAARGLSVFLVGVVPEQRSPLESLYFFLITKNGVPVAYGPAAIVAGCCEMGINLFPEFRGLEIRTIYATLMSVLHHRVGVAYYFLTSYGMGVGNPAAIRTGAFWFYRKLGFRPTNPQVDELAQQEERRMRERPGHRSDRATLRRLAETSAYLDLSGGRLKPVDTGRLGLAESAFIRRRFAGDRRRAVQVCGSLTRRALGIGDLPEWLPAERRALRRLAPLLAMIPDLSRWRPAEKAALVRAVRAKGACEERQAAVGLARHARFRRALVELTSSWSDQRNAPPSG